MRSTLTPYTQHNTLRHNQTGWVGQQHTHVCACVRVCMHVLVCLRARVRACACACACHTQCVWLYVAAVQICMCAAFVVECVVGPQLATSISGRPSFNASYMCCVSVPHTLCAALAHRAWLTHRDHPAQLSRTSAVQLCAQRLQQPDLALFSS